MQKAFSLAAAEVYVLLVLAEVVLI